MFTKHWLVYISAVVNHNSNMSDVSDLPLLIPSDNLELTMSRRNPPRPGRVTALRQGIISVEFELQELASENAFRNAWAAPDDDIFDVLGRYASLHVTREDVLDYGLIPNLLALR